MHDQYSKKHNCYVIFIIHADLVQNEEVEPNNLLMTDEEEGDNENADSMLTMEEAHGK